MKYSLYSNKSDNIHCLLNSDKLQVDKLNLIRNNTTAINSIQNNTNKFNDFEKEKNLKPKLFAEKDKKNSKLNILISSNDRKLSILNNFENHKKLIFNIDYNDENNFNSTKRNKQGKEIFEAIKSNHSIFSLFIIKIQNLKF